MATMTSKLILSLIDRVTAPAKGIAASLNRMQSAQRRNMAQMNAMRGQMMGAAAMAYTLAKSISAPVASAQQFNAEMSNISTLIDTTKESMGDMGKEVLEIARSTPVALSELTSSLYDIRSAGIASSDAMNVLKGSAELAVAGLGTTKQATDLVTSAINSFKLTGKEQAEIYDQIFTAVKNGKTNIAQLSQGFGAVAGTVANAGIKIDEYLSSVAALTTTGLPAAQAHTQIRAAISGLMRETKLSSKVFKELGAKNFKDLIKKSGGVVEAFKKIKGAVKGDDAELLKLLGSVEAYNAVLGLTGANNKAFEDTLSDMRDGMNSVNAAFEKQNKENKALTQRFKNYWESMSISIGNTLLPALNSIMERLLPVIDSIRAFADANSELVASAFSAVAGFVALTIATYALRFAFLWFKGGVLAAAITGLRGIGATAAFAARSIKSVRAALAGAIVLNAVGGGGAFAASLTAAMAPIASFKAAAAGLAGAIAAISWPIWLVIAAVAAMALAIRHYWEPISNFVAGFASEMGSAISDLVSEISSLGSKIAGAVGSWATDKIVDIAEFIGIDEPTVRAGIAFVMNSLADLGNGIKQFVSGIVSDISGWFKDIFSVKDYSKEAEAEFRSAGENAARAIIDVVKSIPGQIIALFKGLGARIAAAIGNIDWSRLVPSWVSGLIGGGSSAPKGIAGARAAGGHVAGGKTYLVGEEGPELVTPSRSGYVNTAKNTASMLSGGGESSSLSVSMGGINVNIYGVSDPESVADAVVPVLQERLKDAMSGIQADTEWS